MSKRKARPAHEVPVDCSIGTCPRCGKQAFKTRKAAKRAMRAIHQDRRLSVYPCGDVYHYGHLSARVKSGDTDRRDLRENT
ncbi:MAG: hypothetical protein SHS37scaffold537_43 [Phage 68_12]|nr:MAG: hypothetical protein SHS37scaffold537_43 [Phage 68_12]